MAGGGDGGIKELRYQVMLALYLPILLYSFSTFDLKETTFAVTEVNPIVVGPDNIVLGQNYDARAYLTAGNKVELQAPDERMSVVGDTLLRMPTGALLGEEESEKEVTYTAVLEYKQVNKEKAKTKVRGNFTVRRPELVATSVATQSLYRQTLNEIRIDVPGLENQPLRLESSTGGAVNGRQMSLSPSGSSVSVRAYLRGEDDNNVYLGLKEFAVIDPPRPSLKVLDSQGSELSSGGSVSSARPVLQFQIEPDREFAQSYPQDANYRIQNARVSIRQGLTASKEIGVFPVEGGGKLALVRQLRGARAQPKDQLLVELQGIARVNHAGRAIPIDIPESSRSFSFTLTR